MKDPEVVSYTLAGAGGSPAQHVLESEAARRVAEGGAPLKDSIVEWRSPFVRKPKP